MAHLIGLHHVAFAQDAGGDVHDRFEEFLGLETDHEEHGDGFLERMIPIAKCHIQILEATGPGVVQRFVDQRGPGLHHIALEVDDLEAVLASLRNRGVPLVDEQPRPGGMGTLIAFIHPSALGGLLVELVERSPQPGEDGGS